MTRIETFLSARLFMNPHQVGDRIFFLSNLSGHISLYAMDAGGSVPEPLLPPHLALQNPTINPGDSFYVFPKLGKILVMVDQDGDENYQPMVVPMTGGFPEPAFGDALADYRVYLGDCDADRNMAYFVAAAKREQVNDTLQANLKTGTLTRMMRSKWGGGGGVNKKHTRAALIEGYTVGDHVLYLWERGKEPRLLYGVPLEGRKEGESVPLNAIGQCHFTKGDKGLLLTTALFDDCYGLGYMRLSKPGEIRPVKITGTVHTGAGELEMLDHLHDDRFAVKYNIDGCSWLYEGSFDEAALTMKLDTVICGQGQLAHGVLQHKHYDKASDSYALSFSTATSPTQIYTVEGKKRKKVTVHTRERVLGIPADRLSPGEDASFTSFDGTRVSARLYMPAKAIGFTAPRPLVYYVHGGPQSQEKPDFAWFSMPLIQYLTLKGFAVFVPNARGSTGYGLGYTKEVDGDWGGDDRLDHVHAMTEVLPKDRRIDLSRAGVVGRSYGGYMTLTLAGRHPDLWAAACDMFGPYDLLTFMERIPETWKPYFAIAVGDPEKDRELLVERSPKTHLDQLACPLLVVQGKNDPRVVEQESRDVVEQLRAKGKDVDYMMFENEGHDVLKYENRVRCYNGITEFFVKHLRP